MGRLEAFFGVVKTWLIGNSIIVSGSVSKIIDKESNWSKYKGENGCEEKTFLFDLYRGKVLLVIPSSQDIFASVEEKYSSSNSIIIIFI